MIGSAISAVAGLASSLVGGAKAGQQRKKMDSYLNQRDGENKAWYNANALGDYTQRADSQNLMKQLRDNLSRENKYAQSSAIVTGATPEQQALVKEQSNKAISDTYANLGAMGQQYKDKVTDRYMDRKNALSGQRMDMMGAQAKSYENLMGSGLDMMGGALGGELGSWMDGKFKGWSDKMSKKS